MSRKSKSIRTLYLIGSLRNPIVPVVATEMRQAGFDVFDDWYSAGKEADECLQKYSIDRGLTYDQALSGYAAQHIFNFDKCHLDRCHAAVLVMPAGKSGHLELGYVIGKGKPGFILMDKEPDRLDVMHAFATGVFFDRRKLIARLKRGPDAV